MYTAHNTPNTHFDAEVIHPTTLPRIPQKTNRKTITGQSKQLSCSHYEYWLNSWIWQKEGNLFFIFIIYFFNFICTFFSWNVYVVEGLLFYFNMQRVSKYLCMKISFWDINIFKHFTSSASSPWIPPGSLQTEVLILGCQTSQTLCWPVHL